MKEVGRRIRSLRIEKGLKQEELAEMLKINRSTLSNIESGKTPPSAQSLKEMKKIFNISIDWILTGEKPGLDINDIKDAQKADVIRILIFYLSNFEDLYKHITEEFFYRLKPLIDDRLIGDKKVTKSP
jgi:transcriptional regulator with XRE-family HTH domain